VLYPRTRRCFRASADVFVYLELLMRMKLYVTAVYLRKHSVLPDIRSPANVSGPFSIDGYMKGRIVSLAADDSLHFLWTVRKTYPRPARGFHVRDLPIPCSAVLNMVRHFFPFRAVSLPYKHRLNRIVYSHLPVKSMLFQCAVCSHGGHQACYRRFYTEMPSVLLPASSSPLPGSPLRLPPRSFGPVPTSRAKDGENDDVTDIIVPDDPFDTSTVAPAPRQLMGHACAAGAAIFAG